jgi:glycosyltransferase involved in cell wall biosynthesis
MQPNVSVIIPTYNREKFIGPAIQSVLDQTYQDFEVIVVDDGSTDETLNVVKQFSEKVRYIYQPNKGRSHARNKGLSLAKGQFVAFLDSDDLYLHEKLRLQVDFMKQHKEFGMVYTSAYCIDEDGVPLQARYEADVSGWIYKHIAFFVPVTIALPTVMVRREIFESAGSFDEEMDRFEDTDMWRRISKKCQIGAMPEFTCRLRTHMDNALATQDPYKIFRALEHYVQKIHKQDTNVSVILRRKGIAKLYGYYGSAMMTDPTRRKLGYILLLRGILSWPFAFKIIVRFAAYIFYHRYCWVKAIVLKRRTHLRNTK